MRLYMNFKNDYYGGRTYSSVYSPSIKGNIVEIVDDFNKWLHAYRDNPYTHTLLGRIMARRSLRTRRDYDQIHTYDGSRVRVNISIPENYIEIFSRIDPRRKTVKSYHISSINLKKNLGGYCDPVYYTKKLKLKIGMVGY